MSNSSRYTIYIASQLNSHNRGLQPTLTEQHACDFTHMVRVNAKFHSDALERRDGDIIVRIPFLEDQQREIYLYLLLEFQSSVDHWMALRFGTYVHLLYEQLAKEKRLAPDGRLPPVFPLLLNAMVRVSFNTHMREYARGVRPPISHI